MQDNGDYKNCHCDGERFNCFSKVIFILLNYSFDSPGV